MIEFQYINTEELNLDSYRIWLKKIIKQEKKKQGEIVYVFCNDNYLIEKNIKFLNHNYYTDVITFDYCKEDIISGDILISVERVYDNAKKFDIEFLSELDRVMAHGLLHLLGYKDNTNSDLEVMRLKENFYLSIK
tara:strand:+ start:675 stop:1079 length:405 start_codon:yes stop_codon:yes gene_type:complete